MSLPATTAPTEREGEFDPTDWESIRAAFPIVGRIRRERGGVCDGCGARNVPLEIDPDEPDTWFCERCVLLCQL